MNKLQRLAVLTGFEREMQRKYPGRVEKEVVFSSIMPTRRRFRADFLVNGNTIIEINGGQWIAGRHNRGGKGYEADLAKMNLAQKNGFRYFQFTYEMLRNPENYNYI